MQKQARPTTAKPENNDSLSPKIDKRQRDSSIDEFEKLEQACSKPAEQKTQQLATFKKKAQENTQKPNKNNRKLFDDDSDQSEPETKDARTDIVKKMFYKQEEQSKPRIAN